MCSSLSYLIKKRNFTSLGNFNNNYKLINATIFSSKLFQSITKSNSDFPVVAALYEKSSEGMNYEYIQNFSFNILNSDKKFILNKIQTIDGHIQKYPIKNNTNDGLKFYTIRDINALLRNTSFLEGNVPNGIDVTIDNLYHYAWLYFFKTNYKKTNNHFLYGNLTPFYTSKIEDAEFKLALVSYAYNNNILIKKYFSKDKIKISYGEIHSSYDILFEEFSKIYVFN